MNISYKLVDLYLVHIDVVNTRSNCFKINIGINLMTTMNISNRLDDLTNGKIRVKLLRSNVKVTIQKSVVLKPSVKPSLGPRPVRQPGLGLTEGSRTTD